MEPSSPLVDISSSTAISGGLITLGFMLVRGKLESLGLLWKKMDELRREVGDNRLADAKEYATRAELSKVIEKLEAHFDKRFDDLEKKLDAR